MSQSRRKAWEIVGSPALLKSSFKAGGSVFRQLGPPVRECTVWNQLHVDYRSIYAYRHIQTDRQTGYTYIYIHNICIDAFLLARGFASLMVGRSCSNVGPF